MRFRPISFKIIVRGWLKDEVTTVEGYAADTPPYRLCAHYSDGWTWSCTDYDTGKRVGEYTNTREKCIQQALDLLALHGAAKYANAQKITLQRLARAGLLRG